MSSGKGTTEERSHDLVIWGASGYTGRLVAEAAATMAGGCRWAIAGRRSAALEALRDEIQAEFGDGASPGIVIARLDDPESLRAMTASTRVVLSTVGPYDRHGEPLVEAAVATGTHVLDITGEVPWVRRMRRRYEADARAAGIHVVSMCGYDSVPSELGVRLLQAAAEATYGRTASEVEMAVGPIRGGFSGGTVASAANMLDRARDPEIREGLRGDHALCETLPTEGGASSEQWGLRRSRILDAWTAPFVMAGVNVAVVQRTHELLGRPWGESFRYRECGLGGAGIRGWFRAVSITLGTIGFALVFLPGPLRRLTRRWFLPASGEGPDATARARGFFRHRTIAADPPVSVRIGADLDPGYVATARMLVACGLAVLDDDIDSSIPHGFCTPGALIGERLVPRLRAVGFEITVHTGDAAPVGDGGGRAG